MLKHACGEGDWLLCWHYTPAKVSHQRWVSGNIYYVHLHKVWIRQTPLWLWNPEGMSPEVQHRGICGPTNGHVSNKNLKKKKNSKQWWIQDFLEMGGNQLLDNIFCLKLLENERNWTERGVRVPSIPWTYKCVVYFLFLFCHRQWLDK